MQKEPQETIIEEVSAIDAQPGFQMHGVDDMVIPSMEDELDTLQIVMVPLPEREAAPRNLTPQRLQASTASAEGARYAGFHNN